MIIHNDWVIEDFSLDQDKSPAITTYPPKALSAGEDAGWLLMNDMTLITREQWGWQKTFEWNFDDQAPEIIPDLYMARGLHGTSAKATQNGKYYEMGGSYGGKAKSS